MGGESKGDELRASVPADGRAGVGADWSQRIAATLNLFDLFGDDAPPRTRRVLSKTGADLR